ncbi:MAG TPA: alpha/beta hydrolase [Fimbriimonadaceae bacterium]|jgi:pimeloyl-ACP methyl ester carboxylesterase
MLLPKIVFALLAALAPAPKHYSFAVNVVGQGKPMILVPGLSCGGDVWNTTVDHYKKDYKCYVLTLPGFAGQPPIPAPILPTVRDEIIEFIADNHLDHPIMMGHSLGGTMVLWVAATAPDVVGKVVAVDGVPFLPAVMDPSATLENGKAYGEQMRASIAGASHAAFEKINRQSLSFMITSPRDIDFVMKNSSKSDPKSVGEAMYEMCSNDLRPEMAKITAPVLELGEGAFFRTAEQMKEGMAAYEDEIKLIPNHTLKMSPKSRHFIMLDDPAFFFRAIDDFLK